MKNKNNRKKAFTVLEIVIALALLGAVGTMVLNMSVIIKNNTDVNRASELKTLTISYLDDAKNRCRINPPDLGDGVIEINKETAKYSVEKDFKIVETCEMLNNGLIEVIASLTDIEKEKFHYSKTTYISKF